MKVFRIKRFANTELRAGRKILNTRERSLGFDSNRSYDMDLSRLGRMNTSQRELSKPNLLRDEIRNMSKELTNYRSNGNI